MLILRIGSYTDFTTGSPFQSAVIFASTGKLLWQSFESFLSAHPEFLNQTEHPLDLFLRQQLDCEDFKRLYGACFSIAQMNSLWQPHTNANQESFQWAQCSVLNATFVDFHVLAESAHLGYRSPLGILLHPEYGPWLGLRFALLTTLKLPETPLLQSDPCVECDKPCKSACPGNAVSDSGWNSNKCYQYHRESEKCHFRCASRIACPIGSEYRYGDIAMKYHHNKLAGREHLAKRLAISSGKIDKIVDLMPWQRIDL